MSDYRLKYHLMPPTGWLNDPNGLCEYKETYHIYYQYCTDVNGNGEKCWGHYTTKDFKHYQKEDIALYPDTEFDKDGVYSGCCYIENGMHFFYTGNVKLPGNHDYTHSGRLSNTIHVYSEDGFTFSDKEVVLDNHDYPKDLTCHIRDPKVFKENNEYYMVLGARNNQDQGCVLVYKSNNLEKWTFSNKIQSKEPFGYMWECPDLIKLGEDTFLITCPQGIEQEGILYENDNQNGYFKVINDEAIDYETLDYGYDFYAPHSFVDEKDRRILIAWLGLPDSKYKNLTVQDGYQNALSLPRELKNINHKIYQYPIQEIQDLAFNTRTVHVTNDATTLPNKASHIEIKDLDSSFLIHMNHLSLKYENTVFSLIFNNDQTSRSLRDVQIKQIDSIDIFLDTSVIEIYLNKGEKVLTSMYYDEFDHLRISSRDNIDIEYSQMKTFEIK